jgi:hypothetical protein
MLLLTPTTDLQSLLVNSAGLRAPEIQKHLMLFFVSPEACVWSVIHSESNYTAI